MKILIIDNYDSFTYNLYQFIGEILEAAIRSNAIDQYDVVVKRNDEITLNDIEDLQPERIIISPGPGSPDDPAYFGVCLDVLKKSSQTTPILGVCLGMQGIAYAFGGDVIRAPLPMHGKLSPVKHIGKGVFSSLPNDVDVMRYHSLIVSPDTLPDCLEVTAYVGEKGDSETLYEIMGIRHKTLPIEGIQFHPESYATEAGKECLQNFILGVAG